MLINDKNLAPLLKDLQLGGRRQETNKMLQILQICVAEKGTDIVLIQELRIRISTAKGLNIKNYKLEYTIVEGVNPTASILC